MSKVREGIKVNMEPITVGIVWKPGTGTVEVGSDYKDLNMVKLLLEEGLRAVNEQIAMTKNPQMSETHPASPATEPEKVEKCPFCLGQMTYLIPACKHCGGTGVMNSQMSETLPAIPATAPEGESTVIGEIGADALSGGDHWIECDVCKGYREVDGEDCWECGGMGSVLDKSGGEITEEALLEVAQKVARRMKG